MTNATLASFSLPELHATISEMINRHSDNKADIREVALRGLDLSGVESVLDLGCGFGFLSQKVLPRVGARARLIGVDACEENRGTFLRLVEGPGHRAEFHCRMLPARLPWADESFDLILASYALYFFVEELPEIARLVRSSGLFLAITHSESSFRNLHEAIGLVECPQPFQALIRNFSAENGVAKLRPFFGRIERVDYENALRFELRHREELVEYVRFKWPLLFPGASVPERMGVELLGRLGRMLEERGPFVLGKNDAVFRCWAPRKR